MSESEKLKERIKKEGESGAQKLADFKMRQEERVRSAQEAVNRERREAAEKRLQDERLKKRIWSTYPHEEGGGK